MFAEVKARWLRAASLLYGGRWLPAKSKSPHARSAFLALASLPFVVGMAALTLIVSVDPYDVRPWGLAPRFADHRYPDSEWPLLLKAVSKRDFDTVLFGASTVMAVTPAQMRRAFGPQTKPVNLSYPLAAPSDTGEALRIVQEMPTLRRIIIVIDHSQMLPMSSIFPPAQMRQSVMNSTWAHAGDFSASTTLGSLNRLIFGIYDRPEWAAMNQPDFMGQVDVTGDPRAMRRMGVALQKHASDVLGVPEPPECSQYPFFQQVLTPALRRLTVRGVQVDLLFPPYPIIAYYDWIQRRLYNDAFKAGPVFPQLIGFKRCALLAALPFGDRVRITAVDNDLKITGDLTNFEDALHMRKAWAFQAMLDHVAQGDSRLTLAAFDDYETRLARNILAIRSSPPTGVVMVKSIPIARRAP